MVRIQLLIALFLMSCMPQKKTKVIFFGDSITQMGAEPGGYIPRIESLSQQDQVNHGYEFSGSGISGNKIYDLYLRMERDVLSKKPDVVTIFIGVNDVWHKKLLHTGTDADKFEIFYQAVIDKIKAANAKIIICTPAVIGEKYDMTNEQDTELNKYCDIVRSLAARNTIPLVDLREKFISYSKEHNPGNEPKGILTYDGVHLNEKGNQLVAEEMWKAIKSLK